MIKNVTIGSDPEFLVYNPKTKIYQPGINYTEGTKTEPEDIGGGFFIQKDNALLEGNIPPCKDKKQFVYNMNYLIRYLRYLVADDGLEIDFKDSGHFNAFDLMMPELLVFGCDPYQNAWKEGVCKASDLSEFAYRTCGFHIHIGYTLETTSVSKDLMDKLITRAFDMKVILPSYLIHFDERRSLSYGGIGQYRQKSYGVEARSLGGYFCHPDRLEWVWDRVTEVVNFCKKEENLVLLDQATTPTQFDSKYITEYISETLKEEKVS